MSLAERTLYVTRWGFSVVFVGLVTGAIAVIVPPMALAGVVALTGVLLLWALPELRVVPEKLLRRFFFIMVFVQLSVPAYYAIDTGYLPWVSVRRLCFLAVIIFLGLTLAGSKSARGNISERLRSSRFLTMLTIGFLITIALSILTAMDWMRSLKSLFEVMLEWYIPMFACILVVRTDEDIVFLFKVIAIALIVDSIAGAIEFVLQRRYYFDIFPQSMLESMLYDNPALDAAYQTITMRNGLYRASSIYSVNLSFSELAAIVAPIGAYFVFHGRNRRERILGVATGICSMLALFCAGARGGYTASLVAMPVMAFIWTIRYSKKNPSTLVGAIMGALFAVGTVCILIAIALWPRLHDMVIGSEYDGDESTQARVEQWQLAIPHIIANPVTGHGMGSAAELVGYHRDFLGPRGVPTIDSYIISLLVDEGVPGLLFFFGIIAIGIWTGLRLYVTDNDERAAVGGPVAGSLIAFAIYRIALSQTENHTLVFLIIGLVFAIVKLARDRRGTDSNSSLVAGPTRRNVAVAHSSAPLPSQ
jgi:O-Antigen ligase